MHKTMDQRAAEALDAAADLLGDPSVWTKEVMARDKDGLPTHPNSKRACKWCGMGAIRRAANDEVRTVFAARRAANEILSAREWSFGWDTQTVRPRPSMSVEDFNDAESSSNEDVCSLFREAAQFIRDRT
jgi:hypothetical protein